LREERLDREIARSVEKYAKLELPLSVVPVDGQPRGAAGA
jgi:hypothetical protein